MIARAAARLSNLTQQANVKSSSLLETSAFDVSSKRSVFAAVNCRPPLIFPVPDVTVLVSVSVLEPWASSALPDASSIFQ